MLLLIVTPSCLGPQEAAVEAEKVYQMEYTSLSQQQRNQVYCHYDHDFFLITIMIFLHYDHDDNGNNQVDNTYNDDLIIMTLSSSPSLFSCLFFSEQAEDV